MTTKKAISEITKQLKTDKEYRRSWSANIAMAYIEMIDNSKKDKLENETPHFGNTLLWAVAV